VAGSYIWLLAEYPAHGVCCAPSLHGGDHNEAQRGLALRLDRATADDGLLDVLRKGVRATGCGSGSPTAVRRSWSPTRSWRLPQQPAHHGPRPHRADLRPPGHKAGSPPPLGATPGHARRLSAGTSRGCGASSVMT